jgi:hypothetical protein
MGDSIVSKYRFTVIAPASSLTHDQNLDATDALGDAGCTDASNRGHLDGMEYCSSDPQVHCGAPLSQPSPMLNAQGTTFQESNWNARPFTG